MQLTVAARVGVVGSGTMGAGIAQIAAQAGHPVLLLDAVEGRAQNAVDGVGAQWDRMVGMGRLDPGASAAARADLRSAADVADLAGCALVIEAAVESLDIKRSIFAGLEAVVDDDCVLATQHLLAVDHRGPGRPPAAWTLYRRAFLQPAPVLRLVEVVSGLATDPQVASALAALVTMWGKTAVRVVSTPGSSSTGWPGRSMARHCARSTKPTPTRRTSTPCSGRRAGSGWAHWS